MPIDERLRAALQCDPDRAAPGEPDLLDVIVGRATRRRRVRIAAVGVVAAAAVVATAVSLPLGISVSDHNGQPVSPPTTSSPTWSYVSTDSALDEIWQGSAGSRADRLAALDETGLEAFGSAIYARYFDQSTPAVQFENGEVTLSTFDLAGSSRSLRSPVGDPGATLHGTFTLRGDTVAMEFDHVPGTTTFHWDRAPDVLCDRLELRFVGTTATRVLDTPAEAFFRMWSVGPLWMWGC